MLDLNEFITKLRKINKTLKTVNDLINARGVYYLICVFLVAFIRYAASITAGRLLSLIALTTKRGLQRKTRKYSK